MGAQREAPHPHVPRVQAAVHVQVRVHARVFGACLGACDGPVMAWPNAPNLNHAWVGAPCMEQMTRPCTLHHPQVAVQGAGTRVAGLAQVVHPAAGTAHCTLWQGSSCGCFTQHPACGYAPSHSLPSLRAFRSMCTQPAKHLTCPSRRCVGCLRLGGGLALLG